MAPSRWLITISGGRCLEEIEGKQSDLVTAQIELEEHRQHEQLLKKENEFLKVRKSATLFHFSITERI